MRHSRFFSFLFVALFCMAFSPATVIIYEIPTHIAGKMVGCPAPTPTGLEATDITPTSISLAWDPIFNQNPIYYDVEGYDITVGAPLPTYITMNNFITYTGLTAGHKCRFTVSASYCPDGPAGENSPPLDIEIPSIIIDDILELQGSCTTYNPQSGGAGVSYAFCVATSNSSEPYSNGVVGSITYNSQSYQFALAYYQNDIWVGDFGSNNAAFDFYNISDSEVRCQFSHTTDLFTIRHTNGTSVLPRFNISFMVNCGNFYSCGSPCGMVSPSERSISDFLNTGTSTETFAGTITPNPFAQSTIFRYALAEEAPVEIALYDATGQLLRSIKNVPLQTAGQHEVPVSGENLPDGLYFLHVKAGDERKVYKLVKQE